MNESMNFGNIGFSEPNTGMQNNEIVRKMLDERGIQPENLPPSEDMKKSERRVKKSEKCLLQPPGTYLNNI